MTVVKRVVCLANSRKLSGRCLAGKELLPEAIGEWVRPVSAREHEEVSEEERRYEDGSDPRILDVVDVPLISHRPKDYQQENWLLDPTFYWEKAGTLERADLSQLVDPPGPLWMNGHHTRSGFNDKIPVALCAKLRSSLRLVHVNSLGLSVFSPGEEFGNPKRRVQGRFVHDGEPYQLWVTDPDYERQYLQKPNGNYLLGGCFLTVSLGEAYKGDCYKLIAAIIAA